MIELAERFLEEQRAFCLSLVSHIFPSFRNEEEVFDYFRRYTTLEYSVFKLPIQGVSQLDTEDLMMYQLETVRLCTEDYTRRVPKIGQRK